MKKYYGIAITLLSLLAMGAISAYGLEKLNTTEHHAGVVASVVSRSGDTVRIFDNGPKGAKVFCVGENIPIFKRHSATSTGPLVGEVRILKFIGPDHVEGKLIVGSASRGDVATKPSAECTT